MLRWYLVHTKPLSETIAQTNLERQGYEVYCPRLEETVRSKNGWRVRIEALFPRYLFLRIDSDRQTLSPVRSTLGVATVVRFGGEFTVVPDRVVCDLRSRADPESGLHRLNCVTKFKRCNPLSGSARERRSQTTRSGTTVNSPPKRTTVATPRVERTGLRVCRSESIRRNR